MYSLKQELEQKLAEIEKQLAQYHELVQQKNEIVKMLSLIKEKEDASFAQRGGLVIGKNIRQGMFETNSSSSHSLSIAKDSDGILDTILPDEDGIIVLNGGEFGWEWEAYNDPLTKANYCAVDQPDQIAMLTAVICQHTGAKSVQIDTTNSYVDHQSQGTASEAFASMETLKRFIFDPRSYLFTGNDNSDAPANFYNVG